MFDPQNWQIRSDLGCNPTRPPLASNSVSYSVQAQLHHEQLPGWPCTGAPEYLIELCHSVNDIPARRNLRSSSQVQLLVPRYRKETVLPQRFICLRTTAVESTSCQNPTSPQRTSTSERDLKLTICNSPRYATEDLCHQCDLYYYFKFAGNTFIAFVLANFIRIRPHNIVWCILEQDDFKLLIGDQGNCDTGIEETKFGSKWYEELSPDFEPLLHVKGRGENHDVKLIWR